MCWKVETTPASFAELILSSGSIVVISTAARTPRIAITTISSINVKPFEFRRAVKFMLKLSNQITDKLVNRQNLTG